MELGRVRGLPRSNVFLSPSLAPAPAYNPQSMSSMSFEIDMQRIIRGIPLSAGTSRESTNFIELNVDKVPRTHVGMLEFCGGMSVLFPASLLVPA